MGGSFKPLVEGAQMEPREQAVQHRGEVRSRERRTRHDRGTPQAGESAGEPATQRGVRGRCHDQDHDSARDIFLLPGATRRQQEHKTHYDTLPAYCGNYSHAFFPRRASPTLNSESSRRADSGGKRFCTRTARLEDILAQALGVPGPKRGCELLRVGYTTNVLHFSRG